MRTIYLLILKLIYDEQMASVSSSSHIVTTLGAINGRAGEFGVLRTLPLRRRSGGRWRFEAVSGDRAAGCAGGIERIHKARHLSEYSCGVVGRDIRALLQTFGETDERQERLETLDDAIDEAADRVEDDTKEITGGTTIGEDTGVSGAL